MTLSTTSKLTTWRLSNPKFSISKCEISLLSHSIFTKYVTYTLELAPKPKNHPSAWPKSLIFLTIKFLITQSLGLKSGLPSFILVSLNSVDLSSKQWIVSLFKFHHSCPDYSKSLILVFSILICSFSKLFNILLHCSIWQPLTKGSYLNKKLRYI